MMATINVPMATTNQQIDDAIELGRKVVEDILYLYNQAKITGALEGEFRVDTLVELV